MPSAANQHAVSHSGEWKSLKYRENILRLWPASKRKGQKRKRMLGLRKAGRPKRPSRGSCKARSSTRPSRCGITTEVPPLALALGKCCVSDKLYVKRMCWTRYRVAFLVKLSVSRYPLPKATVRLGSEAFSLPQELLLFSTSAEGGSSMVEF